MAQLKVIVNSDLTLEAGGWEEVELDGRRERLVHPPQQTMFSQILDYLESESDRGGYVTLNGEALAATNICLRWGSYFAVLADRTKPLHPQVKGSNYGLISHISDGEMARINIEASAALAQFLDLRRQDYRHYLRLAARALRLLPITTRTLPGWPNPTSFWNLSKVDAELFSTVFSSEEYQRRAGEVEAQPTRVFANALINYSWRNGSEVEAIHAGRPGTYSLEQRRIRPSDERSLFRATALRLKEGLATLEKLLQSSDDFRKSVRRYHCVPLIAPVGWTLTEETDEFRLPGGE